MYSFKKGAWKVVKSMLAVALAFSTFSGFSDVELWSLIEQDIKPILGSMTVTGGIRFLYNYVTFQTKSDTV